MSNEGKLFTFNKLHEYEKFSFKESTRSLFSQKDLNSKRDNYGNIEHSSVELKLNKHFETDFNEHYELIHHVVNAGETFDYELPTSKETLNSVKYIIAMGLIGHARHPVSIKNRTDAIFGTLEAIAPFASDELKNQIYSLLKIDGGGISYSRPLDFKKLFTGITDSMGEVIYSILLAPENEYFLLPDCTSAQMRRGFEPDAINGKTYINPAKPIASVLLPINSKILLSVTAERLIPEALKDNQLVIYSIEKELVRSFNRTLFNQAHSEVACENRNYLKQVVKSFGY